MKDIPDRDRASMLAAFFAKDASADGEFFAAITTTGIFCKASCPAKAAKPENIEFFATAKEALLAGFRPCLRCKPLEDRAHDPPWLAGILALVEEDPSRKFSDAQIKARGFDPLLARRHFQRALGMSFQAYCRSRRLALAFSALRSGMSLDEAITTSAWDSHSGFRDAFFKRYGLAPGEARSAAELSLARPEIISLGWIETPLGPMVAGAAPEGLCLLEFCDRRMIEAQLETIRRRFKLPLMPGESPHIETARKELAEYFSGKRREFSVDLLAPGSPFQERVWAALKTIPFGQTRSYAELARMIDSPQAVRAVGHANGLNRIAILIPCHRVVEASGGLGGYGGGLWKKLRLLELEGCR